MFKFNGWTAALLVALVVLCTGLGYTAWQLHQQARVIATLQADNASQKRLNDSTVIRIMQPVLAEALAGQTRIAKQLHGDLIAALKLIIPKRDTLVQHDNLPTTLAVDSTRTAAFRDSTFAGVVAGTVVAPPCCAPLGVSYSLTRPEFSPTVGIIKVGQRYVASVTYNGQGDSVTIDSPYFKSPRRGLSSIGGFGEIDFNPFSQTINMRGGARLDLPWDTKLQAGVGTPKQVFVGLRKDF